MSRTDFRIDYFPKKPAIKAILKIENNIYGQNFLSIRYVMSESIDVWEWNPDQLTWKNKRKKLSGSTVLGFQQQ